MIDTPITEHAIAGLGVGAAFAGLRPVVEFMTFNFAMQAIDQIINSAAKTRYMSGGQLACPIVFRGPNGTASRVAAQHSQDYAAWYAHVPGLIVLTPSTAAEAKGLLKAAIRDPNPVVFLEHELLYANVEAVPDWGDYVLPIGRARIARAGSDVTLVSYARGVSHCLEAAQALADSGIQAEVIDLRSLRPLDIGTVVNSVNKTNRMVTVEEGWPICSIGSELAAQVQRRAFDALDAPIEAVTGADVPMPYAANLEALALPQIDQIVAAAKRSCYYREADMATGSNRIIASPLARHMAQEQGVDLQSLTGSGPNGRIIKRDIEAALAGKVTGSAAASPQAAAPGQRRACTGNCQPARCAAVLSSRQLYGRKNRPDARRHCQAADPIHAGITAFLPDYGLAG